MNMNNEVNGEGKVKVPVGSHRYLLVMLSISHLEVEGKLRVERYEINDTN